MIIKEEELEELNFLGDGEEKTYKEQYLLAEEQVQKLYMNYTDAVVDKKITEQRRISKKIHTFRELQDMIIFKAKEKIRMDNTYYVNYSYTLDFISWECPKCHEQVEKSGADLHDLECSHCGFNRQDDYEKDDTYSEEQCYICEEE